MTYPCDDPAGPPGPRRVVVLPPSAAGGRRVRVDGEILGRAHGVADVAEFLRRAGLEIDPSDIADSPWIDWRGTDPDHWHPEPES